MLVLSIQVFEGVTGSEDGFKVHPVALMEAPLFHEFLEKAQESYLLFCSVANRLYEWAGEDIFHGYDEIVYSL